ncbi:hypothetical protein [Actinomadura macrotermitis]|nr:hypothetical protein [Actinomadura macrotermitis]
METTAQAARQWGEAIDAIEGAFLLARTRRDIAQELPSPTDAVADQA